jgi:hypothetical protein
MVMFHRPEGNVGEGGVRGWWSTALGAGRLYTAARCLGRWRELGGGRGGTTRRLNGGGNGGTVGAMDGGGRKEALQWGVDALYSYQRGWTEGGSVAKSGAGKRRRGSRGRGKAVAATV